MSRSGLKLNVPSVKNTMQPYLVTDRRGSRCHFNRSNINNTYFPLRYGHYECAQELIYHGADVNSVNREKGAPIHYASRVDMVTLLLDHGADAYLARRIDDDKG